MRARTRDHLGARVRNGGRREVLANCPSSRTADLGVSVRMRSIGDGRAAEIAGVTAGGEVSAMPGRVIGARIAVKVRQLAAALHCRTGAESWFAPDTVVISHPKSGRTWLRVMLAEAGLLRVGFSHAGSGEQASLTLGPLSRIVRSWYKKRVLLLVRDPRDVAVSFYFQATRRSRVYSGTFADFLRDPRFGLERALRFNLLWLGERAQFASFGVLSYEQLHSQTHSALNRAAQFLAGRSLDDCDLRRAVEQSSFEALHAMELSGEGRRKWGFRLSPGDRSDPESFKTRRGIVGGWSEYFSSDDCSFAAEMLDRYDYFAVLGAALDEYPACRDRTSEPCLLRSNRRALALK